MHQLFVDGCAFVIMHCFSRGHQDLWIRNAFVYELTKWIQSSVFSFAASLDVMYTGYLLSQWITLPKNIYELVSTSPSFVTYKTCTPTDLVGLQPFQLIIVSNDVEFRRVSYCFWCHHMWTMEPITKAWSRKWQELYCLYWTNAANHCDFHTNQVHLCYLAIFTFCWFQLRAISCCTSGHLIHLATRKGILGFVNWSNEMIQLSQSKAKQLWEYFQ